MIMWYSAKDLTMNRMKYHCLFGMIISNVAAVLTAATSAQTSATPSLAKPGDVVAKLAIEAESMSAFIHGTWTQNWANCAGKLPAVEPFQIRLGDRDRTVDEALFYQGRYGSPLSYARAFDVAESAGLKLAEGSKVFDFGYGTIGQLQMLAAMGIDVVAADVDPILPLMYERVKQQAPEGSIQLLHGQFPADTKLMEQAGNQFDLFISKNTLKKGYIHPTRQVTNPRQLIDLGVDDASFLAHIHRLLNPNGYIVIYNLCPAKAKDDEPYVPWADGECPFTREQLETAGFEILAFDQSDDQAARQLGKLLGWDASGISLENDLFAWFTIVRKKGTALDR